MDDEHVVARIHPHAYGRSQHHVVRQRLGPERIHLEHRGIDRAGRRILHAGHAEVHGDDGQRENGNEKLVPLHGELPWWDVHCDELGAKYGLDGLSAKGGGPTVVVAPAPPGRATLRETLE